MPDRTYHGYTLEQIEKMGGDNEACIAYDMIAHIRELESDLARVTAERDARWPSIDLRPGDIVTVEWPARANLARSGRLYTVMLHTDDATPAAALEALAAKMKETP